MEIHDIFAKIKAHALEGMVFHDEMIRYFDFLNLKGYRDSHIEHYADETEGYRKLCSYYMHHYNRLIPTEPMNRPDVIPDSWYMYERGEVDANMKRQGVQFAMRKWIEWETETKNLYEEMCGEMLNIGEIASAHFFEQFVSDVDNELACAYEEYITLESIGYDLAFITEQ